MHSLIAQQSSNILLPPRCQVRMIDAIHIHFMHTTLPWHTRKTTHAHSSMRR